MSYEICGKCHQPVEAWNEQRRRERVIAACHAMQGLLADSNRIGDEKSFANLAIRYADALIAELEKK